MEAEPWQKEQISRAYLHALAVRDGCTFGEWNVDKDGVDTTLRRRGRMVDVQLKCTQRLREVGDGYAFDLDVPTYDKLREHDRSAPGYLLVMLVPRDPADWVDLPTDQHLLLRCIAYYACIQDRPPVYSVSTTVIHLSRRDRVNSEALDDMFEHSRQHARGIRRGAAA